MDGDNFTVLMNLDPGPNFIEVVATDKTGNYATVTRTINFIVAPKVKVGVKEFVTLQDAYDDAATTNGANVRMLDGINAGPLTADRDITVTLSGGYNAAYNVQTDSTILQGNVTVQKGTVVYDRVTVK